MKTIICFSKFTVCVIILNITNIYSQTSKKKQSLNYIKELINSDSIHKAKTELSKQIIYFKSQKKYDSLVKYIPIVGSFKLAENKKKIALSKAEKLTQEIKKYNNPYTTKEALLKLASVYIDAGNINKAFLLTKKAKKFTNLITDAKKADKAGIEYNLGNLSLSMGNYRLSKKYYTNALTLLNYQKNKDYEFRQKTYNALGGVMWYDAKLDSSLYYFKKSLNMLKNMDKDLMNTYYRPALVKRNMAVLYQATAKTNKAIKYSNDVIKSFKIFIDKSKDEQLKFRAIKQRLIAIDNLGSFYHSLGEFKRAEQLISFSLKEKLKILEKNDPNIIISLIILGQANIGVRDFNNAEKNLDKALLLIKNSKNPQLFWHAGALQSRASVYNEKGDIKNAEKLYKKSETLFRKSLGNKNYNKDFLDSMITFSLFYATYKNNKAIKLAKESYNFVKNNNSKNNIQKFNHTLNLAEVYYKLNNYKNALKFSNEALNIFLNNKNNKINTLDSIAILYKKPKALLINSKSRYYLKNQKNIQFLKKIIFNIEKGIKILEQRKTILKSHDDLKILISDNKELFDFLKKLNLDIYNKTKKDKYLDRVINLHESFLYTRIRARLNFNNNISFLNIPKKILQQEKTLKKKLNKKITYKTLDSFINENNKWNSFLDSLKKNYPKYYKMKYNSIEISLKNLQNNIKNNTTIIRYLFIENELYTFVITNTEKKIFKLNFKEIKENLYLAENQFNIKKISSIFFKLYQNLWQPFEKEINTKNIIIFPDKELFNLSFETLTPNKINSFKELTTNSLLSKYNISYNYSLLLLNKNKKNINYDNNFIAFVPEFTEKMKKNYLNSISDSINLDKTYLNLLPQPFSVDLVKHYSNKFNGNYFINKNSTKYIFKNNAKEHNIIHIGTHAESNNISPKLSRLIFAKNINNNNLTKDNSLYTFEIYDYNLSSKLTTLTACETGKPTYQSGEGMISLAHAFNYAGSESILTSLWKIDEQSSTRIIKLFYDNIANGMRKDKALQKAKLNYINNAQGRTVAPQYWAGLVLIGDTSPIKLHSKSSLLPWFISFALLIIIFLKIFLKK